ncbi:MAG: cadherin-like beta sandwich domain-containing protein, partial [Sphingobacteriales bacterium]
IGDVVTMYFSTNEAIRMAEFVFPGGNEPIDYASGVDNFFVTHTINSSDPNGFLHFKATFYDAVGNETIVDENSTVFVRPAPVNVTGITNMVYGPTWDGLVDYTVTFDGAVTGLTAANFELITTGDIADAAISSVTVNGDNSWTITVNTGTGSGLIKLNLVNATGASTTITNLPYEGMAVEMDRAGPQVSNISFVNSGADAGFGEVGDAVTMYFSTGEGIRMADFNFPGGNDPLDYASGVNNFFVTHTINLSDEEGFLHFKATLYDAVGNATTVDETSTVYVRSSVITATALSSAESSPTKKASIDYTITFDKAVTGLTAANFELVTTGDISGAAIGSLTNNGDNSWTIAVNTGTGSGSVKLNLVNATGLNKTFSNVPYEGTTIDVDKTGPVISNVSYINYNPDEGFGQIGDEITMYFETDGPIEPANFIFPGGNNPVVPVTTNYYSVAHTINSSDAAGFLHFKATLTDALGNTTAVDETSTVYVLSASTLHANITEGTMSDYGITNKAQLTYNIKFDAKVNGVTAANFALTTTGAITGAGIGTPVAGLNNSWNIPVNTGTGDGNIVLSLVNRTGLSRHVNQGLPYDISYAIEIDKTPVSFSNVAFTTSNSNPAVAKEGDVVTMTFTTSEEMDVMEFGFPGVIEYSSTVDRSNHTVSHIVTALDVDCEAIRFLSNITDALGNTSTEDNTSTIIKAGNSANLSGLGVSPGTLDPDFNPATTNYYVTVDNNVTEVAITPTAGNAGATIAVGSNTVTSGDAYQLAVVPGENTSTINVTGTGGDVKSYTIIVNRTALTENELTGISFSTGTLTETFNPNILEYTLKISSDATNIIFTPGAASDGATVLVGDDVIAPGGTYNATVNSEDDIYFITVKAQNGTTREYRFNIRYFSDDAYLSALAINRSDFGSPFEPSVTEYVADNIITGSNIVNVMATPNSDVTRSLTINGQPGGNADITLQAGENVIAVVVTAEDGTEKTYTIRATYASSIATASFTLSPNAKLAGVNVGPAQKNYKTSVDANTTSIMVKPKGDEVNSKAYVNGELVPRNTFSAPIELTGPVTMINIESVAADGVTTMTYSIAVSKAGSNNANLTVELSNKSVLYQTIGTAQVNYRTTVDFGTQSIQLIPKSEEANAVVRINGDIVPRGSRSVPIALTDATTIVNMSILAQDGVTGRTYTIAISKTGSNNAKMTFVLSGKPVLEPLSGGPAQENYKTTVAAGTNTVTITPKFEDANASVIIDGQAVANKTASQDIPLTGVTTLVSMQVMAQDGVTTRSYSVAITKAGSNNANIAIKLTPASKLAGVNAGPAMYNYNTSVDPATTVLTVKPTSEEPNAFVTVDGNEVVRGASAQVALNADGVTVIGLRSVAQDGVTIKTYSITVRKNGSNNADVDFRLSPASELTQALSGGPALINYQAMAPFNQSTVKIVPTAANSKAVITIDGNIVANKTPSQAIALSPGLNMIPISVTAQDGVTIRTYSIALTVEAAPPLRMASRMIEETPVEVSSALSP